MPTSRGQFRSTFLPSHLSCTALHQRDANHADGIRTSPFPSLLLFLRSFRALLVSVFTRCRSRRVSYRKGSFLSIKPQFNRLILLEASPPIYGVLFFFWSSSIVHRSHSPFHPRPAPCQLRYRTDLHSSILPLVLTTDFPLRLNPSTLCLCPNCLRRHARTSSHSLPVAIDRTCPNSPKS